MKLFTLNMESRGSGLHMVFINLGLSLEEEGEKRYHSAAQVFLNTWPWGESILHAALQVLHMLI